MPLEIERIRAELFLSLRVVSDHLWWSCQFKTTGIPKIESAPTSCCTKPNRPALMLRFDSSIQGEAVCLSCFCSSIGGFETSMRMVLLVPGLCESRSC